MSLKVTCVQAYKIVYHFLDNIYFQTYDEFLSDILSGGALYSNISGQKPETMDPAVFGQWMKELKIIVGDDFITYESQIAIEQAYKSLHQYFVMYCNLGAEPSIFVLRDLFAEDFNQSDLTRWLEKKWVKSIEYISQETSTGEIGHLFGDTTRLTHHESFFLMQMFLDNFCKRNDNFDLIQLVQNSRFNDKSDIYHGIPDIIEPEIWDVWQNAIEVVLEQEADDVLNLLSAYKVVPIFLKTYFGNDRSNFINKVIQKFEIDEDNKPVNFAYWSSWTSAAVKLNAKQIELMNDLISIHTPIFTETASKVIEVWLEYKKDLVGLEITQRIVTDQQGLQQVLGQIKQEQRSYLLLDDEVTILETYHMMIKLLESHGKVIKEFELDENSKPADFGILLDWIRICEQVINTDLINQ